MDPYFGVIYLETSTGAPVSPAKVAHSENVRAHHAIHKHAADASAIRPFVSLKESFSPDAPSSSPAYHYPELFTQADGVHEANSGIHDFISIPLQPGVPLGRADWQPSNAEPVPWTALQNWKRPSGQWLSWAFTLGEMSMGNNVAHSYSLSQLIPGQNYSLTLHIAVAGKTRSSSISDPALSIQQVTPWGESHSRSFKERRFDAQKPFVAERMKIDFKATSSEMSFVGVASGYFLINCITLNDTH
ncbi:MAG TPA: hypothetical protein VLE43_13370 [Candidatus Saccharimonadia bacterium]|nr:hypothetical protein [Candidatus Saccharimonadia bacterium]